MIVRNGMRWVAGAIAVGLIGCAAGRQLAKDRITDPGQLVFNGHANPAVTCYQCHNGDGTGSGRGPALRPEVSKLQDAALVDAIDNGKLLMPGFKDKLTAEQKQQLIAWLRASFGGPQVVVPVEVQPVEVQPVEESASQPAP